MAAIGHPVYDVSMKDLRVCGPGEMSLYGIVYDVSEFAARHPGGGVWIRACEGLDATALFESVHVNHPRALRVLRTLPKKGSSSATEDYQKYFSTYALLRRGMRRRFPTRASRSMTFEGRCGLAVTTLAIVAAHAALLLIRPRTVAWGLVCAAASFVNTLGGAYGHNAVHRLEPASLLLDWNGLSSFEWLFEHVISHHPHVNTTRDHDAMSMEPFLRWLPDRPAAMLGDAKSSAFAHLIYLVSETAVAFQGFFGHRLRWKAAAYDAPLWMRLGPYVLVVRFATLVVGLGILDGLLTFFVTLMLAGYFFATLAHISHVDVRGGNTNDFARQQLGNTVDLPGQSLVTLFLDRQRLHHLFPTIDHTRLTAKRRASPTLRDGHIRHPSRRGSRPRTRLAKAPRSTGRGNDARTCT